MQTERDKLMGLNASISVNRLNSMNPKSRKANDMAIKIIGSGQFIKKMIDVKKNAQ
jgi:hypothetical protein